MTNKPAFTEKKFVVTLIFVTSLFLMWGLLHSMSDSLNKHFQGVLHVSRQSGLIQLSAFGAYFAMSINVGLFLQKIRIQNKTLYSAWCYFYTKLFASIK
jgi:FHS family L-fucose permease-like MFS transporter